MVLEISKGEKKYGEKKVFQDFSCKLDFVKHPIYRIEGESGKGKTSLMRILSSLEMAVSSLLLWEKRQEVGVPYVLPGCFRKIGF